MQYSADEIQTLTFGVIFQFENYKYWNIFSKFGYVVVHYIYYTYSRGLIFFFKKHLDLFVIEIQTPELYLLLNKDFFATYNMSLLTKRKHILSKFLC